MSRRTYSILKFRRGNTTVSNALTGAEGELFVDLQANTLVLHDGITRGGHRLNTGADTYARETVNTTIVLAQAAFDYANNISLTPGPQGPTGPQGPQGPKGDTGLRGLTGNTGPQ